MLNENITYEVVPIPPILNPIIITNNKTDFDFHKELSNLPYFRSEMNHYDYIEVEYDQATILTETYIQLEKLNVSIIKSELIDDSIDDQHYGFDLNPSINLNKEIELKIIFKLLVPISEYQHGIVITGSYYKIHNQTKSGFVKDISYIEGVILISLMDTKKLFYQCFPDYRHLNVKIFSKTYFRNEIIKQLIEKKWLPLDQQS